MIMFVGMVKIRSMRNMGLQNPYLLCFYQHTLIPSLQLSNQGGINRFISNLKTEKYFFANAVLQPVKIHSSFIIEPSHQRLPFSNSIMTCQGASSMVISLPPIILL